MLRDLVRLIFKLIGWLLPWVFRLIRLMLSLAFISVTSIFVGVPRSIERIADSWTDQIGLPYHPAVVTGAKVVAVITLILGWLVLASLTVSFLRLVFQ